MSAAAALARPDAIGVVATDLALTPAQAKRLAIMAHDGIGRAIVPAHTPFDGDLIFAATTGARPADNVDMALIRTGHAAAACVARAIARAIFAEAGRDVTVTDIPTTDYPTPAERPLNSRLDCAKLTTDFGITPPDWRPALAGIVKELTT